MRDGAKLKKFYILMPLTAILWSLKIRSCISRASRFRSHFSASILLVSSNSKIPTPRSTRWVASRGSSRCILWFVQQPLLLLRCSPHCFFDAAFKSLESCQTWQPLRIRLVCITYCYMWIKSCEFEINMHECCNYYICTLFYYFFKIH